MEGMRVPPIIDPITNKVTNDILFNGFMAVAMACHKGTSFPANPVDGQWFYHTGNTVNCLFMYMGSSWSPIMSLGPLTLYVDRSSGSDAIGKGYGSGANACATVQYAFNLIPPIAGGNVIVNITAGTYSETAVLQGKALAGDYTITIQGTKSIIESLTAGEGSLQGVSQDYSYQRASVVRGSGTWTANQRQNKWVEFTSGACSGEYHVIDSNTTTALIPTAKWLGGAPASGDSFNVFEPGTTITDLRIGVNQTGVIVSDINLNFPTSNEVYIIGKKCEVTFRRCRFKYGSSNFFLYIQFGALVTFVECYSYKGRFDVNNAVLRVSGGKHEYRSPVFYVTGGGLIEFADGAIVDARDISGAKAIQARGLGQVEFYSYISVSTTRSRTLIRNATTGVLCEYNGVAKSANYLYILTGDDKMPNSYHAPTATLANKLVDTSVDFNAIGVVAGDKVVNLETCEAALVTAVDSATQLSLSADIMYSGADYRILDAASLCTTDFSGVDGGVIDEY